jgi:hypothetical protein
MTNKEYSMLGGWESPQGRAASLSRELKLNVEPGQGVYHGCGKCHTCGGELGQKCHCDKCGKSRFYIAHGYIGDNHDSTPCRK